MLNNVMLAAAWFVAPLFAPSKIAQAYVLAAAVVVAGTVQILVQLPMLRRLGYRFDYNWPAAREGVLQVGRNLAPMLFGLAVTQINTFNDSLIARGLEANSSAPQPMSWLGGAVDYPMQQGAITVLYYGERFYELPVGIVGMAVAVAIFPLLSRHATRGNLRQLGADMTLGLRLVTCLSIPAGVGLMLLADPIARLVLKSGHFGEADTLRAAQVIAWYSTGVWAYCAAPVVVRGFYAMGNAATPVRIAAWMVGLNLLLNFTLIWPMHESGLALSTSIAAAVQLVVLTIAFSRSEARLDWRQLSATTARTLVATAAMASAAYATLQWMPAKDSFADKLLQVGGPIACGMAIYCGVYLLLGGRELGMLLSGRSDE
ncbi:MAG: lipid II flippase MurJ, partial [Thermoguttaceae bacterium]